MVKLTILLTTRHMKLPNKPRESRESVLSRVSELVSTDTITELSLMDWSNCPVKLFADRGYFGSKNKRGVYDDAIFVETIDGDRAAFNANVDPSSSYTKGRASLVANQIVWYRPGHHGYGRKSGHPAFRQASVCVVKRDGGVGNGKALGNGLFQDSPNKRFWINLHRGGYKTTSSHGCQTIPPQQWDAFRSLVNTYLKRYEITKFPYFLMP